MVDDRPGPWSTNLVDDKPDPNQPPIGGVPFNERAALEELEHFRREIERYQALRHGVNHEFEHFVQSFKHPEPARPVTQAHTPPPAPVSTPKPPPPPEPFLAPAPIAAPKPVVAATPPTPPAETFQPSRRIESPRAETLPAPAAELTSPAKPAARRPSPKTWIAIGVIVILAVGGYAWMKTSTDGATPESPATPQQGAVPAPPSATRTPPAQPAAPPPTKPLPFEAVLTTTGPVWVRLIADGERVFERELPAGERIPFTAHESIVIRAGNPGVVRLTIGGVDKGLLGPEGFPVTRRFTVPR